MTRGSRRLVWIAVSFFVVSGTTRAGLAIYSGEPFTAQQWASFMAIGVVFDLVVMPCFLLPWALYDAVLPRLVTDHPAFRKWEARWAGFWGAVFLSLLIFTAAAEFTFWAEFNTRFDFIAVDYLIYTHEVLGNIWQSYPVVPWMAAILGISIAIVWMTWPRRESRARATWPVRWTRVGFVVLAIALGMGAIDQDVAETTSNRFVQQLSTNGYFAFGHAFWNNELDYERYYPGLSDTKLNAIIRTLVKQPGTEFSSPEGISRAIKARHPRRDVNIVLVTVESLSASFLDIFGNEEHVAPELGKLADEGLFFTNLYATGTRTVRGLEALSIGTPPVPGQSIVRRPKNGGLESLGEELEKAGWKPYWIYGGYGFFDNMNAFFDANGYVVIDRTDMDSEGIPIHHENIWGVADEDLYTLVMAKFDQEYAQGNRFFAHVMTTSNHRPYTFPENRIDLPLGSRDGAVKYTDWAIRDFLRRGSEKPWFDNTLFIIVADHTAKAAGRTVLPTFRYHIPMFWYAPKLIKPGVMDRLMSQIDIVPTLLGWLGIDYQSRFFGYDIFNLEPGRERAFISTYQKLGYLKAGRSVVLDVNKEPVVGEGLPFTPGDRPAPTDQQLIDEAIAWYQSASGYFRSGLLTDTLGARADQANADNMDGEGDGRACYHHGNQRRCGIHQEIAHQHGR